MGVHGADDPYVDVYVPWVAGPVRIWEPMTLVTDLVLAVFFWWSGARLLRPAPAAACLQRRLWAGYFFLTGISPVLGGLVHAAGERDASLKWSTQLCLIALGTWFHECLLVDWIARASPALRRVEPFLRVLFAAQLAAFVWVILRVRDDFFVVLLDYVPTTLVLLVGLLWVSCRRPPPGGARHAELSAEVWHSQLILLAAAVAQAAKLGVHADWFNHNDTFHVVQCYSTHLLGRAALGMVQVIEQRKNK